MYKTIQKLKKLTKVLPFVIKVGSISVFLLLFIYIDELFHARNDPNRIKLIHVAWMPIIITLGPLLQSGALEEGESE